MTINATQSNDCEWRRATMKGQTEQKRTEINSEVKMLPFLCCDNGSRYGKSIRGETFRLWRIDGKMLCTNVWTETETEINPWHCSACSPLGGRSRQADRPMCALSHVLAVNAENALRLLVPQEKIVSSVDAMRFGIYSHLLLCLLLEMEEKRNGMAEEKKITRIIVCVHWA